MEITAAPAPPDEDLPGRYSVIVCVQALNGQALPDSVRPSQMVRQIDVTATSSEDALDQIAAGPVEPVWTLHELEQVLRDTSRSFAGAHVNADVALGGVRRRLSRVRS